ALFAPDRRFVGADCNLVILAGLVYNIGADLLTEDVLLQDHPIYLIPGLLLPFRRQLLHDDHVVVVHCRDRQGLCVYDGHTTRGDSDAGRQSFEANHGVPLLISDLTVTPSCGQLPECSDRVNRTYQTIVTYVTLGSPHE